MQSEQVRQRKRERKRIQRDEKRRCRERVLSLEIDVSAEWRREIEPEEETHMCARDELDLVVPRRVATLLAAAMQAVRKEAGRPVSPGECLGRIARHYIDKWESAASKTSDQQSLT